MKKFCVLILSLFFVYALYAQKKKEQPVTPAKDSLPKLVMSKISSGPKKYEDLITEKAITKKGLFTIHKIDDKWYFEIPDSMFNREARRNARNAFEIHCLMMLEPACGR